MRETIFDGMQDWTHENSHYGLYNMMTGVLTGCRVLDDAHETIVNQLLTFMVRDLERAEVR